MGWHEDSLPVLVGVGQVTENAGSSVTPVAPMELIHRATVLALDDTRSASRSGAVASIDAVSIVRFFSDANPRFKSPFGRAENPPWSLLSRLRGTHEARLIYGPSGGDSPQRLVNQAARRIAAGETQLEIVAGGEALRTQLWAQRSSTLLDWAEPSPAALEDAPTAGPGFSATELQHGMVGAIYGYPLLEQLIRKERGRTLAEHQAEMGRLFARFADVARHNPLATRRQGYDAHALATPSEGNPWVMYPYTKLLCSNGYVDQAASLIVCSVAKARTLGIPSDRWVYLHGMAEGTAHPYLSERASMASNDVIRAVADAALQMAQTTVGAVDRFDIYSCFPAAVEMLCSALELSTDDPRPLTTTGGLPYFGGPGNNYSTHGIASMVAALRDRPGTRGLVAANGGISTKHAMAVYATEVPRHLTSKAFADSATSPVPSGSASRTVRCNRSGNGTGTVLTYTLSHKKGVVDNTIVIGNLANGDRFLANIAAGDGDLGVWTREDMIGRVGRVQEQDGKQTFTLLA